MPPKRPRAPSSPEPGAVAHTSRRRSPTSYNSLPAELKINIINLACLSTPPSKSLHDLPTCLALSLVSKQFHAQTLPHLYRQISITRPSSLYSLHQTLQSHPERGPLIRNLHIGSQSSLPFDWWPISQAYPEPGSLFGRLLIDARSYSWLSTSLSPGQLPAEFEKAWPLDAPKSGCRAAAIDDALQVAQSCLGVDLLREGNRRREEETRRIGAILQVQAVLDLYLTRIKEIEDADPKLAKLARPGARVPAPCRNGKCDHYPTLFITEVTPPSSSSSSRSRSLRSRPPHIPPGTFVLPRSKLLRHASRRGAVADRFDHPLLIERSGATISVTPPPGRGHEGYIDGKAACFEEHGLSYDFGDSDVDGWSDLASLREADEYELAQGAGRTALNAQLIDTASLGSSLRLARSILSLASGLQNLSLTGFLERAIGKNGQYVPNLRRLSIGPPPPWWTSDSPLEGLEEQIEDLRVGGILLVPTEVDFLVQCHSLKEIEWSMGEPFDEDDIPILSEIFGRLVNETTPSPSAPGSQAEQQTNQEQRPVAAFSAAAAPPLQAASERQEEHAPSTHPENDSLPLVIPFLSSANISSVLATAASPQIKEAWLKGLPVPGVPRRLLLMEKKYEGEVEEARSEEHTSVVWDRLHEEGKEWWLRGAI